MTQPETATAEPEIVGLAHDHRGKVDHLERARSLKSDGDLAGAVAEARRAVFDDPADEEALTFCARLARQAGQKEIAAAAYGRLGEIRSDDAGPLIQHARVLIEMKDYEGAVMVGMDAVTRDNENPEAYQVVGIAYLAAGELPSAIGMFEKVITINPDHGWAQNNLGFALLRANQNERAAEVLTRAAELLPNVAAVHNNLGVALERTGRIEEAKASYAMATSLSPKYVKAKVNSARVAKAVVEPEKIEPMPMPTSPEEPLINDMDMPQP